MPSTDADTRAKVRHLVEKFERHREAYHAGRYNETQLRRDYLDPLFEALGWDVHNARGYAESYREVVHEDARQVSRRDRQGRKGWTAIRDGLRRCLVDSPRELRWSAE